MRVVGSSSSRARSLAVAVVVAVAVAAGVVVVVVVVLVLVLVLATPPPYQPPGASTHRQPIVIVIINENDSCRRCRGSGPLSVIAAEVADAHLP